MSVPSVVLFGYGELAIAAIDALTADYARILAVVVPSNWSGHDIDIIKAAARDRALPVWVQPKRTEIEPFVARLRGISPDVIVVWSHSMILPLAILDVPHHGAVNVHGGLLPGYRGGHVMQWALLNGETETGVTLHYLDTGIDTGPVIAPARFPIDVDDDAVTVKEKLKRTGASLLIEWWPRIADGTAPRIPQDESKARYWRMRTPDDGLIDWSLPAVDVVRLVRALACNHPGAHVETSGGTISIKHAKLTTPGDEKVEPGEILGSDARGLHVAAVGRLVLITDAMIDGRRLMGADLAEIAGATGGHLRSTGRLASTQRRA